MMSELGGDAKLPDLWRMSALLELCPRDVKEQMMMRLDGIGENYENLKARVVSYTTKRLSKREEDRHICMCRWRWTTWVAANQKRRIGKMWTRFEGDRHVTLAG